jgi:hypothetical protein
VAAQLYYPTFDLIYILKGKEMRGSKSPSHSQVAAKQIVFSGPLNSILSLPGLTGSKHYISFLKHT